nr:hypothetical protein [Tanacetum cinerariifolium]
MLATGRYPQWRSQFLRYIDTRPNGEALRKCILSGPYKPTTILVQAVEATDDSPAISKHTTVETPMNMTLENKAHFEAEKEAIHLILTGIGVEIFSTVDACQTAQEIHKGKEIAKPIAPLSDTAFEEDSDPGQAQRDKDMQKHLALIAKYFKKIYKPTNNNLKTSSNSKNKNVDTTLRFKNDNQSGQFRNHRTVNVAGARENIGSPVVQQSRIQCFNCKEFRHFSKECRKPKRVKNFAYHKEKMLLCKQGEQGVPLQAEQYDWLNYMAKIQEVPTADSGIDSELLEQVRNDTVWNEKASNVFRKEREQYIKIQYLKAQLQDKNISIRELKKLIEKGKGKYVDTKFDKPSVVRQPNAQRIPKPLVLVTAQTLPQTARQAVSNTNVLKPGMYRIDNRSTKIRAPQLPQTVRDTNPRMSTFTVIVQLILFIVDSGCTKHMTGNLKLLCNFIEKFLGTIRFGNDHFTPILGYGDLGNDLLTGNRGSNLYTISLQESTSSTPLCLMAKASPTQAWLWHRRLSHLNFDYINLLSKINYVLLVN